MRKKYVFLFPAAILSIILFSPVRLEARYEVENTDRLRLLQKATGQATTTDSYRARLDAILTPSATPAEQYVGREDQSLRDQQQALAVAAAEPLSEVRKREDEKKAAADAAEGYEPEQKTETDSDQSDRKSTRLNSSH